MTNRTLSEQLRNRADAWEEAYRATGPSKDTIACMREAADALDEAARVLEKISGVVAEYAKSYRTKKVALGAYQACADVDKRARAALAKLKAVKEKEAQSS